MLLLYLSVFLYAVNNILWKKFVLDVNPFNLISKRAIFTVSLCILSLFWLKEDVFSFASGPQFFSALLGSVLGAMGLIFLVFSFKNGTLIQYGFYSLAGSLITAIYTFSIRGIPITHYATGALLIVGGFLLFIYAESSKEQKNPVRLQQHIFLSGMIVCFSLSMIIQYRNLQLIKPILLVSLQEIVVLLVSAAAFYLLKAKGLPGVTAKVRFWQAGIMALVVFFAVLSGANGLKITDPFLSSLISLSGPVLTMLGGLLIFNEKVSFKVLLSIGLIIAGSLILR